MDIIPRLFFNHRIFSFIGSEFGLHVLKTHVNRWVSKGLLTGTGLFLAHFAINAARDFSHFIKKNAASYLTVWCVKNFCAGKTRQNSNHFYQIVILFWCIENVRKSYRALIKGVWLISMPFFHSQFFHQNCDFDVREARHLMICIFFSSPTPSMPTQIPTPQIK